MSIAPLIDERPFGAVVCDLSEEVQCLSVIQARNKRFAGSPLSPYFLVDLLAPLEPFEFGAAACLSSDWQAIIDELKDLIERAIDRLRSSLDLVCRPSVFDWRNPEMEPAQAYEFPRWAREAVAALVTRSYSIFKRGGDARAGDSYLLDMARSYVPLSGRFNDGQLYTCLAIAEATKALWALGEVVSNTEGDEGVSVWIKHFLARDVQSSAVSRKAYGKKVNEKIADALPDYLAPRVMDVMDCRVRAEKLMLLGDALAAGMLSPADARKLSDTIHSRRKTQLANAEAATTARRILTDEKVKEIRVAAQERATQFPGELKKTLYAELASAFGVSYDTIKRALGVKKRGGGKEKT
ncbi:hypothetical protein [Burkholderia pseudomallei]|uniref:hypothetical protein n=1 Tax=Burkholderia pseudomallei TaxID=28450 RepID=UPI001377E0AE|nr:hypothetical protein [Burkholderia pseudomallei]